MNLIRRVTALFAVATMLVLFLSCQQKVQPPKEESLKSPDESFLKYGDTNETIVELSKVNNSVWIHTSYFEKNGSLTPSNGVLVVTEKGLVLVDTPWTEKQMESLEKLVREAFNGKIKEAIVTHMHPDKMGGASYLVNKKIPIASLDIVAKAAKIKGLTVPDKVSEGDFAILDINNTKFEIYFPGEGYTADNTVVWLEKYKVLFAGCLVKEYSANSLGDISEANVRQWPITLKGIEEQYPNIEVVIPGHGQWGDTSLMKYTLELLEE